MLLVLDCVYPPESRWEGVAGITNVDSFLRGPLSEERGNEMLLCFGGFNLGPLDFRFFDSFIDFQWDYVIRFKLFTINSEYR